MKELIFPGAISLLNSMYKTLTSPHTVEVVLWCSIVCLPHTTCSDRFLLDLQYPSNLVAHQAPYHYSFMVRCKVLTHKTCLWGIIIIYDFFLHLEIHPTVSKSIKKEKVGIVHEPKKMAYVISTMLVSTLQHLVYTSSSTLAAQRQQMLSSVGVYAPQHL